MKFRCVIVDDETPARRRLKRLLADQDDFEIVGEAADAASAVRLLDEQRPDLCFLDVRMPEGDAFQVLRQAERMPHVIFTTAYDQYAVRAFEVNSLDYLLKPFSKSRFHEALDRARQVLASSPGTADELLQLLDDLRRGLKPDEVETAPRAEGLPPRISARRGAKILLLDPEEVLCFEAEDTLVFARLADGRYLVERTLAELETLLAPRYFRAHRGCLVNLAQIAEILPGDAGSHRIVLRDENRSSVGLSRRQARKLRELIPW